MITGNYSILLIGDSIIAALPRYSNVWKRYFQLLNAVNYGIYGDRGQNISWRCQNITSSSNPQNAIIMCGTKKHQTQLCRRHYGWDCRNFTLIKTQIPSNHYICLSAPLLW